MRMLRWGAELAVDPDVARSNVGVGALRALRRSELLQRPDERLVGAVFASVAADVVDDYDEGDTTEAVE